MKTFLEIVLQVFGRIILDDSIRRLVTVVIDKDDEVRDDDDDDDYDDGDNGDDRAPLQPGGRRQSLSP